ncbi:hypothetical protein ACH5RR_038896 [Cinchona calisaya]|uniref:AAA+ ATPase domain-containing protein n=1 Tax=Cinchona calisaya TaxID=153742 RepID=A0ABD2Y283_9GENT
MEVLAAVVGSLMTESCRIFFSSIHAKIDNFLNLQSYFTDLDKEMKGLTERRDAVNEELQAAKREGLVPRPQVQVWLRQVHQIEAEIITLKQTSGGGCCYIYCSSRKILKKAALEKLTDVKRLVQASSFPYGVAAPVIVEHLPGPSIGDQPTAAENMAKLMDLLNDDEVKRIGVWGMGGVGKTTLVKNVNNKLVSAPPTFTIIMWVTVSKRSEESSDLKRVQKEIAVRLKMDLNVNEDSADRVAIQLHERLKNEKFLLILDDVWDPIDLDTVGVPRPEAYPGTKILLTTRFLEVCGGMMTDRIFRVEILKEGEAWRLFCERAGEVATSKHVETLAKAITRECCGLPLAIIVVGASMRGKKKVEQWEDALRTLRRSEPKIRGIESQVYNPLKWSYDSLSDKGIKFCFLICCLYPEDCLIPVDELVRYWFAEGLLGENQSLEEVRSKESLH